jgi:hypothetical protein
MGETERPQDVRPTPEAEQRPLFCHSSSGQRSLTVGTFRVLMTYIGGGEIKMGVLTESYLQTETGCLGRLIGLLELAYSEAKRLGDHDLTSSLDNAIRALRESCNEMEDQLEHTLRD